MRFIRSAAALALTLGGSVHAGPDDAAIDPAAFPRARFIAQIDGLIEPICVRFENSEGISIAERDRRNALRFDLAGNFLGEAPREPRDTNDADAAARDVPEWLAPNELLRRHGSRPGQFCQPGGFAVHGSQVVVADTFNHRLQLLDSTGSPLAMYMKTSLLAHEGRGALRAPSDVAVSSDGHFMAVLEAIEQRCQIFALTDVEALPSDVAALPRDVPQLYGDRMAAGAGAIALYFPAEQKVMVIDADPPHHLITELGEFGARFGQFQHIGDMRITPGNDAHTLLVEVVDDTARRISVVSIDRTKSDPLGSAIATFVRAVSVHEESEGTQPLEHVQRTPTGLVRFVDAGPRYVCDARRGVVRRIGEDGEPQQEFGSRGGDDGEFANPVDVAPLPGDRLAVLDIGHQRVLFFSADGQFLGAFGADRAAPLPEPAWRKRE